MLIAGGLVGSGVAFVLAWQQCLWGATTGVALIALALSAYLVSSATKATANDLPSTRYSENKSELDEIVKLRLLLDALPTPLINIEANKAYAINRAARTRFGSDKLIANPPQQLFDARHTQLIHEGHSWGMIRLKDGADEVAQTIVALVDIEKTESIAEARAISELLQTMGHELMNGLAPVVSLAESAMKAHSSAERDDELISEILGTLVRQVEGLQRFIAGYRKLSRLPTPAKRTVTLSHFIDDVARLFRTKWPRVALQIDVGPGLQADFDRDQVSQALWAILQNAVEAIGDGGESGLINLSVHCREETLVIAVKDNGPGIPLEAVDLIFRPFHSTKADGTGIGLGFARTIALAHGGTLTARPSQGGFLEIAIPAN